MSGVIWLWCLLAAYLVIGVACAARVVHVGGGFRTLRVLRDGSWLSICFRLILLVVLWLPLVVVCLWEDIRKNS